MGLYAVNLMGGLLAILTAVGAISSEVEQGTLTTIVVKPLGRWEVVVGKWLGYGSMLAAYVLGTGGAVVLIVRVLGDYAPPNVLPGLALLALESLLLLSLTLAGSTLFAALTNGIVLLVLYTTAVVGGMVEQIGSLLGSDTMVNIGIVTSLLVPSDVLWKLATYLLQANLAGNVAVLGPFAVLSPPSNGMVVYAILYTAALLGAASLVFQRKDL
ncbi:MAG: ABC transporter permease [Chloroflexi bacterium]|nr:ABC transporter permease [Chloroflexota bacterium]